MSEEERKITQAQIDETVDLWMNGISINDTDYEKAKYVYELLALNTEYVPDATDSQNIISAYSYAVGDSAEGSGIELYGIFEGKEQFDDL